MSSAICDGGCPSPCTATRTSPVASPFGPRISSEQSPGDYRFCLANFADRAAVVLVRNMRIQLWTKPVVPETITAAGPP